LLKYSDINCFYDVGANLGHHSLLFLSQGIDVFAFEPNHYCHSSIKALAKSNEFTNLTLIEKGVGESESSAQLVFPENETWLGKMDSSNISMNEINQGKNISLNVEIVPLDHYIDSNMLPDLIKIDTEGFEYYVLNGSKKIIEKKRPYVIFEVLGERDNFNLIFEFFDSRQYMIYKLPINDRTTPLLDIKQFDELQANYLAVHASRKAVIDQIISQK
jgi:FkbM family methyltransferase